MSTLETVRVLRGVDLLDLTFRFVGLAFAEHSAGRRLVRADPRQEGLLVVVLGPQHVTEHAVAEGEPREVPVGSLVAGRTVLVFEVGPQDVIEYSEAGLLEAMRSLPPHVVDAAREADPPAPAPRPGLSRQLPAAVDDPAGRALVLARLLSAQAQLDARYGAAASAPATAAPQRVPQDPFADPASPRTGVELPYRLLLSPSQQARWSHRDAAGEPASGGRVELWHTRLSRTTVRAVWNRDRAPGTGQPEVSRLPLTAQDRTEIVELTSRDGLLTPQGQPCPPQPVDVEQLLLSAAGGWLDSSGQWPRRPRGISLSDWRHRATLGRDHYVRVMREGFLCPFGHRATLVKVTERTFAAPRAAFLSQRFFVVVRQRSRTYDPHEELPASTTDPTADLTNLLFPFTSVRLDTLVTPDLAPEPPTGAAFFPGTAAETPFRFRATAVDHEGRVVEFRTPLLFVPEELSTGAQLARIVDDYNAKSRPPTAAAGVAPDDELELTRAALQGQSVALAPSVQPDDTSVEVADLFWSVAAPPALADPGHAAPGEAAFLPQLSWANATLPAIGALSGGDRVVPVVYAPRYALSGFAHATSGGRTGNPGEVLLHVLASGDDALTMDFHGQAERSGGLLTPSFDVAGLSRKTGPVAGAAAGAEALNKIADGTFDPGDFFHPSEIIRNLDVNLLGVLSLADIVQKIEDATALPALHVPAFLTETVNAVTGFLTGLRRAGDFVANTSTGLPPAAGRVTETARNLARLVGDYLSQHLPGPPAAPPVTLEQIDAAFAAFSTALTDLLTALPRAADPGLRALLDRLRQEAGTWTAAAGQAPALRDALQAAAQGVKLPQTVQTRLEWNPAIQQWPSTDPLFAPHPDGRLSLVADLRGSLRPDVPPGADVSCSLENFDLVLVPPFKAMRLTFRHVRVTQRAGRKPDIDVALEDVAFIGALSFVQTLRRLIPLDGFSDPPGIQVTPAGITARYAMPLPNLAIGVFSLENIRLDAYLDLPFIGRPLEVGFSFCSRQAPFRLTVSMLGGGGFFGIVLTPKRVAVLEAALEFGAAVSMDFGVASGSLSVMAGIYFRLELDTGECRLTGYFRARGEVDVLGIVSASVELCLELSYDVDSGTVYGRARITVSVHIGFWSQSVSIECEKRFLGSGPAAAALAAEAPRPPTFAEMMSPYTDPVTGLRRDPVDEYCTAFAEVS
ncbi:hypothetical protein BLA24_33435 [Streptomyces cinnamoneus]|uniref:Uncharacterized protein n=1 Tax=Streptomyces cinnamoneus TaxID=53446 RepID=A0A2G1XAQ2_STRCJ|nr:hypothetical protein [Streptomyces cinnamoneus]PHQ48306.1 hypothetical protein BLA24_33435 [Streptomyces cinnamoneus]PPT15937.1 hypothetical protein CYQ11_26485 [Streptomyces cinnamoneus]